MNASRFFSMFFALFLSACATGEVRIASWNLGWHISQAEVPNWIERCSRSFAKDASDGVWKTVAANGQGATVGWLIKESRPKLEGVDLAVIPPCGVYQTATRANVPVTVPAFAQRTRQLAKFIADSLKPDIIAFQEVSGKVAVAEALGALSGEFEICSFDGQYKLQRLAFAWRKAVATQVGPCRLVDAISLPHVAESDRVRPGFQVDLKIGDKLVRLLNVHLKSGCVSPLDGGQLDSASAKEGACDLLQQQVRPLEAAIENLANGTEYFIVLGDFNRNIWHERSQVNGAKPIRSDGSEDLKLPLPEGVKTQNLLLEVNDGDPPASELSLLPLECVGSEVNTLCQESKRRKLDQNESRIIARSSGLGCRNGIGLDHMLASKRLVGLAKSTIKLSIGRFGGSQEATANRPDPLLAISDHCPIVASFDLN